MSELTASDRIRPSGIARATRDKGQISRVQTLTPTNWQSTLMTAAAILVVLTLSFASLKWVNHRFGDDNNHLSGITHYPLRPEATPVATPQSDPLHGGFGGADRSFNMGDVATNLSDDLLQINAGEPEKYVTFSQIVGDLLLRQVSEPDSRDSYLEAVDLNSGEVVWTFNETTSTGYAFDGTNLFTWVYHAAAQSELVALNLQTGEIAWKLTDPSLIDRKVWNNGPIYVDGMVYATSGELSLIAVDSTSGELQWHQTRDSVIDRTQFTEQLTDYPALTSIAINGDELFIAWQGITVEALDRITGDSLWTYRMVQINTNVIPYTVMSVDNKRIYISVTEIKDNGDINVQIIALDQAISRQLWTVDDASSGAFSAATAGDFLIGQTFDGHLIKIDKMTGDIQPDSFNAIDPDYPSLISTTNDSALLLNKGLLTRLPLANFGSPSEIWKINVQTDSFGTPTPSTTSDIFSISVPMAWNFGLIISTSDGKIWFIAPEESTSELEAQPTATIADFGLPVPTQPRATKTSDSTSTPSPDELAFGPVSSNLSETPELYSVNLPTIDQSMSVKLIGDTLVRATAGNTSIETIDIVSGNQLWTINLRALSPITSDGSNIYLAGTRESGEFGLVAIDLATGQQKWFVEDPSAGPAPRYARGPIVSDGVVYASDGASTYFAVNASTGTMLWDTDVVSALEDGIFRGKGAFAVGDGHVYVASTIGSLVALDTATGDVSWSTQYSTLVENGQIESEIVIGDNVIYVSAAMWLYNPATPEADRSFASGESYASAFDSVSGSMLWQSQLNTATRTVAIVDDVLLFDSMGMFETVDLPTGEVLSSIKYTNNLQTLGPIRVSDNRSFTSGLVGDDLVIFEIDGHEIVTLWRIPAVAEGLDHVNAQIFAWNNGLLVLAPDGSFYHIAPTQENATPTANSM